MINKIRWFSLLLIVATPALVVGQPFVETKKKQVGEPNLNFNVGFIMEANDILNKPGHGLILGLEKRRHRFVVGPTFGLNLFYPKGEGKYQLKGFMADYSLIFAEHVEKKGNLACFAQFQYHYQERVQYYDPPAQDLVLYSQYQESYIGIMGLEARAKWLENFQLFYKLGFGIEFRTNQTHYPYYAPYNYYKKFQYETLYGMFGIVYSFSTNR
jgi:hypothetical protein